MTNQALRPTAPSSTNRRAAPTPPTVRGQPTGTVNGRVGTGALTSPLRLQAPELVRQGTPGAPTSQKQDRPPRRHNGLNVRPRTRGAPRAAQAGRRPADPKLTQRPGPTCRVGRRPPTSRGPRRPRASCASRRLCASVRDSIARGAADCRREAASGVRRAARPPSARPRTPAPASPERPGERARLTWRRRRRRGGSRSRRGFAAGRPWRARRGPRAGVRDWRRRRPLPHRR